VMILELAQHVQQYLHANNKPPAPSFYEEMMSNKRRQEERLAEEQRRRLESLQKKEEKERQMLEDEIQRRQEALKEETKRSKEEARMTLEKEDSPPEAPGPSDLLSRYSPIGTPTSPKKRNRVTLSPSPCIVRANSEPVNNVDQQRRRRHTSTPRRDSSSDSDHVCKDHTGGIRTLVHGELVAISEWVLKWRHCSKKKNARRDDDDLDKEAATYLKQVISIEQELLSLLRLHHSNLVHYHAIKYQQEPGKILVYILMEFCGGMSLDLTVRKGQPLALDVIKSHTEEILAVLEYLHSKDVTHKNLRASSVFVDNYGKIRVADYSIERRLSDLFYQVEQARPGVHFTDNRKITFTRGGKKGDIYQLGMLLLSLAIGAYVTEDNQDIPTHFPPEFQDFLTKCLMKDDRLRWSTFQLLEHSFIKNAIVHHITTGKSTHQDNKEDKDDEKSSDEEEDQPLITPYEASGHSRLTNEFEVLKSLGKGGFGDVIKVRNKLDRRLYAIKRIPLNPKSKQFNKKITREVKLLSRLNHENVVRYFNSWIETSDDPAHSESSSSMGTTPRSSNTDPKVKGLGHTKISDSPGTDSLGFLDDVERLAPKRVEESVDWSVISYDMSKVKVQESDSEEDDEADVFGTSFLNKVKNFKWFCFYYITMFVNVSVIIVNIFWYQESKNKSMKKQDLSTDDDSVEVPKLQYLYIQMEYCEKSTLRNCIDSGLYQDMDRVWRLFREIVEGLIHIHEQGMIHRDLKPVNIFLDSNDQVKIGDFGLATTSIIPKSNLLDANMLTLSATDYNLSASRSGSGADGDLTGKVGTALYVSPEMMTGASKIVYSQKVDIYSLGIIFFEMCYKALPTGMERVKVLGNIRLKEVKFPEDFDQLELENQTYVIKWLLNHDPAQRPTSKELIQSDHLPPPQMEEAELNEILRSTISDPHSKSYRRMISAMFSQTINAADDLMYDSDLHKGLFLKVQLTCQSVYDSLVKIFQRHGGVELNTPLLMPKCDLYNKTDQYPCLMDHSGHLVALPFDLRIPFARYVARNNVVNMKRYSISKVYRAKKVYGQHPRELTECAFDIVSSTPGSLIPDAELLIMMEEIIAEFPVLQQRTYYIRVNHVSVLHAVFLHAGVPQEKFHEVQHVLSGSKIESQNKSHGKSLTNLGLNEQTISTLLTMLEIEGPYNKVSSYLKSVTKTRGEIFVTLGLVYNPQHYSGLMFQVLSDSKKKKRFTADLLAAGGRYDNLVKKFYSPLIHSSSRTSHYCVGVSIAFEKIVHAILESRDACYECGSPYDVLVCTIGHKPMLKERMCIIRELWNAGIRAEIQHETMQAQEDIQEFCRSAGISYMVVLKDGESGVKIRSIEKDRISERKINTQDVKDYLQQKLQKPLQEPVETIPTTGPPHNDFTQTNTNNSMALTLNFNFMMQEGKVSNNTKKKFEAQMYAKIMALLSWLPGRSCEVIAVELKIDTLKAISAYLEVMIS
ncbi:hypothetical protein FSP39_020697, partial [Pinctada imbricata]